MGENETLSENEQLKDIIQHMRLSLEDQKLNENNHVEQEKSSLHAIITDLQNTIRSLRNELEMQKLDSQKNKSKQESILLNENKHLKDYITL